MIPPFAGMEVGIVFALIGAIVGEYLGANEGLGNLVVVSLNALNAPELFGVIILLAGLGIALGLVFLIVPGIVLCGIICAYAVGVAIVRKVPRQKFAIGELLRRTGRGRQQDGHRRRADEEPVEGTSDHA